MSIARVALCQMNCRVGDISGNVSKVKRQTEKALAAGADVICFPELTVCGYPPEDLLLKPGFTDKNLKGLEQIVKSAYPLTIVAGFVERRGTKKSPVLYNSAAVISGGKIAGIHRKNLLPNYGVFDENRYFAPGDKAPLFQSGGFAMGVSICEDIWFEGGPVLEQARGGADLIINISASPYSIGKPAAREKMLRARAKKAGTALAFCNMTGGQDELVFDGHSAFFDKKGAVTVRGAGFREDMIFADFEVPVRGRKRRAGYKIKSPVVKKVAAVLPQITPFAAQNDEIFSALVLGTRDYVEKNGFETVVIGLSGGIDSALVAAVAVEALGPERVVAVNMPSIFSSKSGIKDSQTLAANLGVGFRSVPIDGIVSSYEKHAPEPFKLRVGEKSSTALENIQARARGNILMAFSNRFGWLVLTTGNKSEVSVGYSTLYGDTAGGFAVIKDVKKTLVYELSRHYNKKRGFDAVPKTVIEKPPSAELKPNQLDSDSLPPYDVLDEILKHYVENDKSVAEVISLSGASARAVRKIVDLVDRNEYKRRQTPPGVKLTDKAFGKDRRMPITNFYRN
ncbi:MAG: NAD+ synthase [Candidatus Mycalebacterium zealandia]|nr:MAG: NAD+ synthase [Candidatus Mycalebacterium zealandia]